MKTIEYLESKEIKPSLQRIAVMTFLFENRTHPTADEIFGALSPKIPTLSRTTVYNTLDLLVKKGAIIMIDIDTKHKRYDGDISLHAHFKCDTCERIEDIEIKESTLTNSNAPQGAKIRDTQLLYKGICKECNKNNLIN